MATLTGVNVNKTISVTFLIGSVTAAIGGILISAHIGQINFYIGFLAGIKAFVAAVLGGIGSIPGAVLGSLVLGWSVTSVAPHPPASGPARWKAATRGSLARTPWTVRRRVPPSGLGISTGSGGMLGTDIGAAPPSRSRTPAETKP